MKADFKILNIISVQNRLKEYLKKMVISADQAEKMCGLAMTVPAAQDSISKFVKIK